MRKSSFQTTFLPAQTSLLSSIQRAKQRIFSKSQKSQSQTNITKNIPNPTASLPNDQNNPLNSNLQPQTISLNQHIINRQQYKRPSLISNSTQKQKQPLSSLITDRPSQQQVIRQPSSTTRQQYAFTSSTNNNNNASSQSTVATNAIKLLQQKIHQLQQKNKHLEFKLNESRIVEVSFSQQKQSHQKEQTHLPSAISEEESDIKSYLLLKQQCETLQKQNKSLFEQLSKQKQSYTNVELNMRDRKESGRKLNFHHQISQNISAVYQATTNELQKEKLIQTQQKLQKAEHQLSHYKGSLENERKKNFAILKLHQEEIIKNQELQIQVSELKGRYKQLQESLASVKNRKSVSGKRSSIENNNSNAQNSTTVQVRQSVIRQKNLELEKQIITLKEQLQSQRISSHQKVKEVAQLQRRYIEVKESFIELYRDLLKYHPEVINQNIKFLYERVRRGEDIMMRSRSILSNKFGKFSQSRTGNRLSEFRSKSGKKGLKMEDLNSSKRSHSRDRTNSNRSISKSNYRSPYAQQNITKKSTLKSALSPSDKQRHRSTTGLQQNNKAKLSEIQRIIKEIKQVSKQIKTIKAQHRNLSVKLGSIQIENSIQDEKSSLHNQKNQQRMNELIEEYNQKNAKLQQLKSEKDRLALETVPDMLL